MRKNPPGYLLPSGELGEDEIVCQLVYLPDRDEYWQAFFGALHYMTTWRAWERDDDLRGKDAAANWREAFDLTVECWRMTCLEEITERLDIMIDLLGNQSGCCGTTTIGPIITVVTNIVPGEGDDPTEWGETGVADWEEWSEYICYHAHVYVDSLINSATAIDVAIELGSYTIDFFVSVMNFLQYMGLDQVLGLNQVMMVYDAFRSENDMSGWFAPLADKFEDARAEIVCSIINGTSLSDAVEAAIDDNVVWLLFYVLTDYTAVQALIYEGTVDGVGYLPPIKRDDCMCEDYGQDAYGIWPSGETGGWHTESLQSIDWDVWECMTLGGGYTTYILEADRSAYPTIFGIDNAPFKLVRIEFDYQFSTGGSAPSPDFKMRLRTVKEIPWVWETAWEQFGTGSGDGSWDEWHHVVIPDSELADVYANVGNRSPFYFNFGRTEVRENRMFQLRNVEVWVVYE